MALLYEGFSAYTVGVEVLLCEVEKLVMHLIMTFDDDPSVSADKSLVGRKGLISNMIFFRVRGGYIVTCTRKTTKFRCW